jgi:hypothetical protein
MFSFSIRRRDCSRERDDIEGRGTVCPIVRLRATRASAAVRSNSECTSSTEGACGVFAGIRIRTPMHCAKRSRADRRIGTIWATMKFVRRAPHGKRSVRLDALRFERLHRLSQLGVGSGVAQRKPILRSPVQVVAQSFRQFVGDENPSREIKDERRQPNRRQRRSRGAGTLQLEPRRHEG